MHSLIGEIAEEGLAIADVRVDPADHLVGVEPSRVEVWRQLRVIHSIKEVCRRIFRRIRLFLVVVGAALGQDERIFKPIGRRQTLLRVPEVPLAGHVGVITGIAQHGGNGYGATVQPSLVPRFATLIVGDQFSHIAQADYVVVHAGHQHAAGRRAHGTHVKVQELISLAGQAINVGRKDLAAVHTRVGPAHVISDDQQDVRPLVLRCGSHHDARQEQRR